jgi:hypothetical protein
MDKDEKPLAGDEAQEKRNVEQSEFIFANMKRTYDQYQTLDARILEDAQTNSQQIHNVALQALQNAVETANMVSKQAVRHSDIAIDRQWNVDEQAHVLTKILRDAGVDSTVIAKILVELANKS